MNYKARRRSLALAKRLISNEVVRDDKWNKKFTIFVYILNGVNRGALLLVIYPVLGFAQSPSDLVISEFPSSWAGDWAGELQIFNKKGMSQSLPMQLNIQAVKNSTDYSFTIIYGLDIEKGTRAYVLKTVDAKIGHYLIDEQNSIEIDAYLLGEKLVQRFEVMGNLLETFIEKRDNNLVWEIFSGKHEPTKITGDTVQDGEDIPRVKTFTMGVYQKCILSLVE